MSGTPSRTAARAPSGNVEVERRVELVDAFGALDVRGADVEAPLRPAARRIAEADAGEHDQQLQRCRPTSQTGAISHFATRRQARSHSLSFGFF